jgi:hypothetical protein
MAELKDSGGLSSALHAADALFTEPAHRIGKHFLPQTALD